MTQSTLPLAVSGHDYHAESFICSASNQAAYDAVMGEWGAPIMVLTGKRGSGKTHLASAWAEQHGAVQANALSDEPAWWDVDVWHESMETPLFHACNQAMNSNAPLLLVLPDHPANLPITLPDLASRLKAAPVATIGAPDDALLKQLLIKQLSERQLSVAPNVVDYLLSRMERSYDGLHKLVDTLDAVSLRDKKPISLSVAREALEA